MPLALHLEDTTESGIVVALLFVAFWAPTVVLAGPAGLLADRFDGARWTLFLAGAIPVGAGLVALALSRRRLVEPAITGAAA